MKTILKLYDNGNFETVNTTLIQSEAVGNYVFDENSLTVPKIIEYPPPNYRNYFIEKTSVSGWVTSNIVEPANEADRASDYIDVRGWELATIRIRIYNADGMYSFWTSVVEFDESQSVTGVLYDNYATGGELFSGNFEWEFKTPIYYSYLRVSTSYYDRPGVTVKVSVERGDTNNTKHYLAPEDMPEWVRDTRQPVSIFKEGIVILGDLVVLP